MGKKKHAEKLAAKARASGSISGKVESLESHSINYGTPSTDDIPTMEEFQTASFARRKITSNWQRYEQEIEAKDEDAIYENKDFTFLLNQASTDGSHFQLSMEKKWDSQKLSHAQSSSLFAVDLNILSQGLSCIPFHERISLDESKLSSNSVERYVETASKCIASYDAKYRSNLNKNLDKDFTPPATDSVLIKSRDENPNKVVDGDDDGEDDLEDWLDSVLDK